jgi:outer membrane protein OmpA-like peptidoglycan-associated protein
MKKAKHTKRLFLSKAYSLMTGVMFSCISCAQTTDIHGNETVINGEYDKNDLSALAHYLKTAFCPHELSVWTAGGVSVLNDRPSFDKTDNGFGGASGIGYTYFLSKHWGLSSGLEYAFYQSKIGLNGFSETNSAFDIFDNPIDYNTRIDRYGEKRFVGLLNIPLSVLYQTEGNHKFYASSGLKLGLPLSAKYRGSNAVLTASGYYPDYNQTEIWQNDLGYGVFNLKENNGNLNLGISLSGTLESGAKWNTGIGTTLYTGIFADYGYTALSGDYSKKPLAEYNRNKPSQPLMNGACALSGRFSLLFIGVKLKMAFQAGCRDLSDARKAYKYMQTMQYDDYFDFTPETQVDTIPPMPAVVPADTLPQVVDTGIPETMQPCEADTAAINAERKAYLEAAKARRQKYSQSMNVSNIRNTGNYNRGIVTLTAEQKAALDDYADVLLENPLSALDITGHTCDLGTDELNMRIGQERAELAKDYLVERGVAPSRISTFSRGETEPLFPNTGEENRKKHRRLEIIIKKRSSRQ